MQSICCPRAMVLSLLGTGLRSEGFLVRVPVWTKHGRCFFTFPFYQNTFRALPRCPRARYQTIKCLQRALRWAGHSPRGEPCLRPYVHAPRDPERDKWVKKKKMMTLYLQCMNRDCSGLRPGTKKINHRPCWVLSPFAGWGHTRVWNVIWSVCFLRRKDG